MKHMKHCGICMGVLLAIGMATATWAQDPTASASSGSPGPSAEAAKEKLFLRHASEGGMAEVAMGKMAVQEGKEDDVKAFGQKMVDDHTLLMQKLKAFADQYGVMSPKSLNKEHMEEVQKLQSLTGDDFDKEYITAMMQAHHHDLKEFKEQLDSTQDASLKATLQVAVKVILKHMHMIREIAKAHGVIAASPSE